MKTPVGLFALIATMIFGAGCASKNVNPAAPRPHTGYVDFYTEDEAPLCWQVDRMEGGTKSARPVFIEYAMLEGRILRLAFAPGPHQFRVTFLNRVITQPGTVTVEVKEGMIVPVQVTLVPAGKTLVEFKQERLGGTYYGRYGRGTKFGDAESTTFTVSAEIEVAQPYKPKAGMPYANAVSNSPAASAIEPGPAKPI